MVGAKVRRRTPSLVVDEIQQIMELGFDRINIADDLFASDTGRVKEICNLMRQRGLRPGWSAFARVDTVTQEMFDVMAEAGCDSISFGVESGSPEMLKRVRKGITLEQARQAVLMCKKSGMLPHASFMVGLPGETHETLKQTAEFAGSLDVLFGYHYLAPFPGTTLCEKIDRYDLEILTRDWSKYDANDAIVRTSAVSAQDIRNFVSVFEKAINDHWQEVIDNFKTGKNTPYDDLRVEGHYRMNVTYAILQRDLIEQAGFIGAHELNGGADTAVKILAERMKAKISADPVMIEKTIRDFVSRGYLKQERDNAGVLWSWK